MTPEEALSFLDLSPTATPFEIKRAYHRRAKQVHPDLFQDPKRKHEAEVQFKNLRAAVDTLASGYTVRMGGVGVAPRTAEPFDPQDVYGNAYSYSFDKRTPLARSPLLGCLMAFLLPVGAVWAFDTHGVLGLALYLLTIFVLAMIARHASRVGIAFRRRGGIPYLARKLFHWEHSSPLYDKWMEEIWLIPVCFVMLGPAVVAANQGTIAGVLAYFVFAALALLASYLLRLIAGAVESDGKRLETMKPDSQVIEIQGRHRLVEELLGASRWPFPCGIEELT